MHTSAAPNVRNVKQSSQAWNSLPQNISESVLFDAGFILKILLHSIHVLVRNIANRRTDKRADKPTEMKT